MMVQIFKTLFSNLNNKEEGSTISEVLFLRDDKNAIVCIVFPRPISSQSIPPKPSVSNVFK